MKDKYMLGVDACIVIFYISCVYFNLSWLLLIGIAVHSLALAVGTWLLVDSIFKNRGDK